MKSWIPVALVFGLALTASAPRADGSQRQLLVSLNRSGNFDIWLINEDGSGGKNLTNHPAEDSSPAWSPDGKQIAFQSDRDGQISIYVMDADGNNLKRLTRDSVGDVNPAWSPDGSTIIWCRRLTFQDGEIFAMRPDGSQQINLTKSSISEADPAWSPNGFNLACNAGPPNARGIYFYSPDGSNPRFVIKAQYMVYSAFSPDGKTLAFSHGDPSDRLREIWSCGIDGSNLKRLTALGDLNSFVAWSPDGKRLAFQHHDLDWHPGSLYIMNADGSDLRQVISGETHIGRPFLTGGRPAWKPQ